MARVQNRLLVKVARLYYEHDMTQSEIAKRLRLSRPKVQRLLQQARDEEIVRIVIQPVLGGFPDLEDALENKYGLKEAVVVETTAYEDQATVTREVGVGAAEYFSRVVQPGDKIMISWGGSMLRVIDALESMQRPVEGITVFQGLGGIADPNSETHAAGLATRFARILGGQAVPLHAPGVAGNRAACDTYRADPYIAQALQQARSADIAFVGIGAPRPDSILVQEGSIVTWEDLQDLMQRGAVGDINLHYFNERGEKVDSDIEDRIVGVSIDDIKKIRHIVGVAGGSAKLMAISGALAGKLVNVLVTDHVTAGKLLND